MTKAKAFIMLALATVMFSCSIVFCMRVALGGVVDVGLGVIAGICLGLITMIALTIKDSAQVDP